MKYQTHSSALITNGLTGNDDDNGGVYTQSSIVIALLLTFWYSFIIGKYPIS